MPILSYALQTYYNIPLSTIAIMSSCALGDNARFSALAPSSAVYTTANRAVSYPFSIAKTVTVYKLFVINGTVVSGNFDIGIYSKDYQKIVSLGSTAQAGTSVIQETAITAKILYPGQYNMAFSCDNITATFFQQNPSSAIFNLLLCRQMASAFVLPTSLTSSTVASMAVPIFGAKLINV